MNKHLISALLILTLTFGGGVASVSAQSYTALQPLPCVPSAPARDEHGAVIPGTGVTCTDQELRNGRTQFNFSDYTQFIFNLVIAISASAAVFMIVAGGFQYMTTDSWSGKSAGLERLKSALLGLLLVLTSYLILRTVNPGLVAIPSTLVAPLNVTITRNTDAEFFDDFNRQMAEDARAYHIDQANFQANRTRAQTDIDAARGRQNTASDALRDHFGDTDMELDDATLNNLCSQTQQDPEVRQLCAQRSAAQNAEREARQVFAFNTARAAMRASMEQCGSNSEPQCIQNRGILADITGIYERYASQVNAEQQRELGMYGTYAQSSIDLVTLFISNNLSRSQKIARMDALVNGFRGIPGMPDELKYKLTAFNSILKNRF